MSLPSALAAIVADVLSAGSLPGGGLLTEATRRVLERRLAEAREIWLDELRRGDRHIAHIGAQDELAAILYRYQRAAIEGSARLNLRLLAAVAAGQAAQGGFAADDFLAWTDTLAALRREELILLAEMRRAELATPDGLPARERETWRSAVKWTAVYAVVIPEPFGSEAEVMATAASVTRSGLAMPTSGTIDMPVTFITTPKLERLLELAPLEAVLGRAGRAPTSSAMAAG